MVKMLKWIAVFLLLGACAYSLNEGEAGFDEEAWQNDFMNTAHYNIEPVGRRKKPNARLDTSSIDIWCAAVDPQTGEIN